MTKNIIKKFGVFFIINILVIGCEGGFHHDPLKDYPEQKNYVPLYDRKIKIQYYLENDAVEIKIEPIVEIVRGEKRELEVSFNVEFLDSSQFYIKPHNFPNWLNLSRVPNTDNKYVIFGTAPKDFIASGINGDHKIKLEIVAKSAVPENIVKRLSYYETIKEISLVFVNGQGE